MKNTLKIVFLLILALSCTGRQEKNEKQIAANPYLTGTWAGEGRFLNTTLNADFGPVTFEIIINEDNTISGKIGEARLTKTSIRKASFDFAMRVGGVGLKKGP